MIPAQKLSNFIYKHNKVFVITGAGVSTESGIPDYRGPNGAYRRPNHKPIQYQEFLNLEDRRKRYWARSYLGWPKFKTAKPNAAHLSLTKLQKAGYVSSLVTQNVDGLHSDAGTMGTIELHGSLRHASCLLCKEVFPRDQVQTWMDEKNPSWQQYFGTWDKTESRPDGDLELIGIKYDEFNSPTCPCCGSYLIKPGVVMFGENVHSKVLEQSLFQFECADAVLALGTSLQVFSAYRYIMLALQKKKPVAILNLGSTRADNHPEVTKIDGTVGEVLPLVAESLLGEHFSEL